VKANCACPAVVLASWIKPTAMLASGDLVEGFLEVVFEQGLETSENKVPSCAGEYDERQMKRNQIFTYRVAVKTGE
jgi:hypothetical protein